MPDERRENDRYRRQSLFEQAVDELRGMRRHPRIMAVLGVIVLGGVVLQLAQPQVIRLEDLRAGDCIYIPTPSGGQVDSARAIGTSAEAANGLVQAGAERAPCDGSHSHEVAAAFVLADPSGTPFPGPGVLEERQRATCEAAFATYIGHAVAGSRFDLTVVVPTQVAWEAGRRAGACIVSNTDATFMASRAGGSGE